MRSYRRRSDVVIYNLERFLLAAQRTRTTEQNRAGRAVIAELGAFASGGSP